ncbi:hypothetical protein ODZ84_09530 [Chryseobacterium fluminis]|uniref:hypothetical protein n=1 Tax=Chryseobacterium fluminis TaxID=2983606 RepID=UPI00224F3357|nr:hypothetical protein [Chryseobacterium sp. MMS21-Ot14]UZT99784.1 hypothetical protein ODZ84_09530 [Chryseobacterium sp. MMS21-Ot14]
MSLQKRLPERFRDCLTDFVLYYLSFSFYFFAAFSRFPLYLLFRFAAQKDAVAIGAGEVVFFFSLTANRNFIFCPGMNLSKANSFTEVFQMNSLE